MVVWWWYHCCAVFLMVCRGGAQLWWCYRARLRTTRESGGSSTFFLDARGGSTNGIGGKGVEVASANHLESSTEVALECPRAPSLIHCDKASYKLADCNHPLCRM